MTNSTHSQKVSEQFYSVFLVSYIGFFHSWVYIFSAVSCGVNNQDIIFFSIPNGLPNPILVRGIALSKARVYYFGTVVHSIPNGQRNIFVVFISIRNGPQNHYLGTLKITFVPGVIVLYCSDDTRNMGAMVGSVFIGSNNIGITIQGVIDVVWVISDHCPSVKGYIVVRIYPSLRSFQIDF